MEAGDLFYIAIASFTAYVGLTGYPEEAQVVLLFFLLIEVIERC